MEDKAGILERSLSGIVTIIVLLIIALALTGRLGIAVVEGISMEPTFHTGDIVFLEKKVPGEIQPGDIVVYKRYNGYIIHRVIGVANNGGTLCYIVKGDNNPFPDPPLPPCGKGIPYSDIIGVVAKARGMPVKIPYLGGMAVIIRG